jgi:hypothetical protein
MNRYADRQHRHPEQLASHRPRRHPHYFFSADGEILISLNKENHAPTRDYEVLLRKRLHR